MGDLIKRFDSDMESLYYKAAELGYRPAKFLQMVRSKGGYVAAKQLIHTNDLQSGLTKLWELGRLDLSVEAHIIKPEYLTLFTDEERQICSERLALYNYPMK